MASGGGITFASIRPSVSRTPSGFSNVLSVAKDSPNARTPPYREVGFPKRKDGLAYNNTYAIHRDPDGVMWFGTRNGGVSRYDGKAFVTFTTEDGLANDTVWAIHGTPDGTLWFGTGGTETTGGGVSRYHPSAGEAGGQKFATFTTKDGLAHPRVYAIYRDPEGRLWFGTGGGGVSVYDGVAWSSLDTADGLAGDDVFSIHPDADGALWFGTDQGATRYRRSTIAPRVHIVSVTTNKTYLHPTAIPTLTTRTRATVA